MRVRTTLGAMAAAVWLASAGWWGLPSVRAASPPPGTTCTWGGTPAVPTGTFSISPGLTNAPSTAPSVFKVTGALGGGCTGTLTYNGQIDAGGTCSVSTFEGKANGIPGVRRFAGVGVNVLGPARLYDKDGNVVGIENAQVATPANAPHFMDCGTPQGFTGGTFSSLIVLAGR